MPRNGTGTYTLPRPPFVPGTVISSADVNADFSDIASALTGSLAANGETSLTAALRGIIGVAPAYTFVGDIDTGFGSDATDTAYVKAGGVKTIAVSTAGVTVTGAGIFSGALTIQSGGITVTAGGVTITAGGLVVTLGGATITGNTSVTGTFLATGVPTFSSTSHMIPPTGTTAQRPGGATAGSFRYNTTLNLIETFDGTNWVFPSKLSTFQPLTAGSGATYTTPAGVRRLRVRMTAGGAGGGGSNTASGGAGVNSSFSNWTTVAGSPGTGSPGSGGTGGTNGTGTLLFRVGGGVGGGAATTQNSYPGGPGGVSFYGGNGFGLTGNFGNAAVAYGSGGAGGGQSAGSGGGGGGAGETVEFIIDTPAASYVYTVGTAGAGGVGGNPGAAGFQGFILVEEIY